MFQQNDDSDQIYHVNKDETCNIHFKENTITLNNYNNEVICNNAEEGFLGDERENIDNSLMWPQVLTASAGASLHLQFGVILGFTAVVLPVLSNPDSTELYLNTAQISVFSSINFIGTVIGALLSGFIIAKVGQRITILLVIPLGVFGWILIAYTTSYYLLILSRIVVGLLVGACENASNSFMVEVLHTSVRGRFMAINDVVRPIGFLYVTALASTSLHWQTLALICGLSTLVLPFLIYLYLPNSPRWLATHGRKEAARKSLTFFRGRAYNVDKEIKEIFEQLEETPNSGDIAEQLKLFKNRRICRRFLILSFLMLFIHFTGNMVTVSYSVTIYQDANTSINEYLGTIISSGMRIVGSVTNFLVSDRYKRKSIIIPAMILSSLSIACLGVYFYILQENDMTNKSWIPLVIMMTYLYSTTIYMTSFIIIRSELLPTSIRAIGNGIHFLLIGTGMFITIYTFPYMVAYIGHHWTFWIYAINSVILLLTIFIYLPETKDKTLEQIANDI